MVFLMHHDRPPQGRSVREEAATNGVALERDPLDPESLIAYSRIIL